MPIARSKILEESRDILLRGYCVQSPALGLRGRARKYHWSYQYAFEEMLQGLRSEGYVVVCILGRQRSQTRAHYHLYGYDDNLCEYCRSQILSTTLEKLTGG